WSKKMYKKIIKRENMYKAIFFDLDNTLIWDEKSVAKALQATCQLAKSKYNIDTNQLIESIIKVAEYIYSTYERYGCVNNIETTALEAVWGEFNEEGKEYEKLRVILQDFGEQSWVKGLESIGVNDSDLAKQMSEKFIEE